MSVPKHIHCENCGVVLGPKCIRCETAGWLERVADGLIERPKLKEGKGPLKQDPSHLTIAFRASRIRENPVVKNRWCHTVRIVKVVHDPLRHENGFSVEF